MNLKAAIQVDFNNIDNGGLLFANRNRATRSIGEGDVVLARDSEGNSCHAAVARLEGDLAFLDLDMASWTRTGGPFRGGCNIISA